MAAHLGDPYSAISIVIRLMLFLVLRCLCDHPESGCGGNRA